MPTLSNDIGSLPTVRDIPSVVYATLKEAILKGHLEAGSRINMNDIAERFGISKIPIREALRMLEKDRWVFSQPHRGTYVRPMSKQELSDIFEVRKLMEPHSARLAAKRRTAEQVELLQRIVEQTRHALTNKDLDAIVELNKLLHETIAKSAGNSLLAESLEKADHLMRRYFLPVSWEQRESAMLQHVTLVQAIAQQNEALAERLALAHVCHTESLANQPLDAPHTEREGTQTPDESAG